MAERASIKKVSREQLLAGVYHAEFTNGKVVSFDFTSLFPGYAELAEVPKGFIAYGVKQKLDDSMAGAADIGEAIEELESTIEALNKGKWTLRVAGEGAGEAGGLFARALAEARGISLADAKSRIAAVVTKNQEANKDASERALVNAMRAQMLQSDSGFAAIYNRMQAERNAKAKSKHGVVVEGL